MSIDSTPNTPTAMNEENDLENENENEEMSVDDSGKDENQPKRTIRKWTPQEVRAFRVSNAYSVLILLT